MPSEVLFFRERIAEGGNQLEVVRVKATRYFHLGVHQCSEAFALSFANNVSLRLRIGAYAIILRLRIRRESYMNLANSQAHVKLAV